MYINGVSDKNFSTHHFILRGNYQREKCPVNGKKY